MSAKLFNEPPQSDRPPYRKTIKRIDDLILDAEKEAEAEINRKIRSSNTKTLLIVLVGVGLFYFLYTGIQNKSIPVPSFLDQEPQVALAPPAPSGPAPKPIPFPLNQSTAETDPSPQTPSPALNEKPEGSVNPLENKVLSMLSQNLGNPGTPATKPSVTAFAEPAQPIEPTLPALQSGQSPFAATTQIPPAPVEPAVPAVARTNAPKALTPPAAAPPEVAAPRLTTAQSNFIIQVGAYSIKSNADRVIKKLMTGGFSPLIQTRMTRSSMHIVFIGGFADIDSPQNMVVELKKKGLNPSILKNDNGSYSIILGKEKSKKKAEALKEKFTRQGIFTSLKQMKVNSRLFIVRVEGFESNTNAQLTQKKIENMGYKGTLIRKKS